MSLKHDRHTIACCAHSKSEGMSIEVSRVFEKLHIQFLTHYLLAHRHRRQSLQVPQ